MSNDGWISVDERLPDKNHRVLVFEKWREPYRERIALGRMGDKGWLGWWECTDVTVTHWMPLPAPPTGVTE